MTSLDLYNTLGLAITFVFLALFIVLVIVVRARTLRKQLARAAASGKTAPKGEPKPKKGGAKEVQIVENGPAGTVYYFEDGQTLKVYWEFGGGDAMAILYPPKEESWDTQVPWATGRRREVLEFVAKEVIRQKAPGCDVRWSENYIELVKG